MASKGPFQPKAFYDSTPPRTTGWMSDVLCVYNMLGGCRSKRMMLRVTSRHQKVADEGELRFLLGRLAHFQAAFL